MHEPTLYSYHLSGRRAGTIFVVILFMLMAVFGVSYGAPWYFLAPLALGGGMAIWAIIANPQTGSTLTAQHLSLFNRGEHETIDIADISHMEIRRWTDGPDTVILTLTSGRIVQVSSMCADSKLAVALRDLGVRE